MQELGQCAGDCGAIFSLVLERTDCQKRTMGWPVHDSPSSVSYVLTADGDDSTLVEDQVAEDNELRKTLVASPEYVAKLKVGAWSLSTEIKPNAVRLLVRCRSSAGAGAVRRSGGASCREDDDLMSARALVTREKTHSRPGLQSRHPVRMRYFLHQPPTSCFEALQKPPSPVHHFPKMESPYQPSARVSLSQVQLSAMGPYFGIDGQV